MAFRDFPKETRGVPLLQRSLQRGRLAHAYLLAGHQLGQLEIVAQTLAKTLNCLQPTRADGIAVDCCDACVNCRKIEHGNHADIHWVRAESRSRIVTIEQIRELMREIQLKPTEAGYKLGIIVAADRMRTQAANAFLKTLEEPPPRSVFVLLTADPQRVMDTIRSRCLRLTVAGECDRTLPPAHLEWLTRFGELAAAEQKSLLNRYRLLDSLVTTLAGMKSRIEETFTAQSPLERYEDVEKDLREHWEDELAASIEAEYRLQRMDLLAGLQLWLRDVWVQTLASSEGLLNLPGLASTGPVGRRLSTAQALENLRVIEQTQRLLHTNVQEALALEVGLLKLNL